LLLMSNFYKEISIHSLCYHSAFFSSSVGATVGFAFPPLLLAFYSSRMRSSSFVLKNFLTAASL